MARTMYASLFVILAVMAIVITSNVEKCDASARRHILQFPTIPAALPKPSFPPLPSLPTLPTIPKLSIPPLPNWFPSSFPNIPYIPNFLAPPPSN
ncbi:hypothetical protein ACP275_08G222200 [Erythranthe tilingii]